MKSKLFNKKLTLIALILAAVALVAAGCGDDDDDTAAVETTATSAPTTTSAAPTTAAPEPDPCDIDSLTVATGEPAFLPMSLMTTPPIKWDSSRPWSMRWLLN